MRPRVRLWIPVALVMAAQIACGGASPQATSAPSGGEVIEPTSPPAQIQPTEPPSGGSDVSGYVACEIVTAQDVADLVGGTVSRELDQQPSPNCIYEVDPAGEDNYAQFLVYIEPTDMVQPLIEAMPEQLGDPVAGIGDAAYLEHDDSSETYHLIALVRNRFGLEVIGDQEDWVLDLGKLFLSRMVGP
ncbi:MAG TPA: hypothetical protein VLD63_09890 [Anaerolineales bacterium]|nr:hypothetical protein [Anaerolineales bacterium]